MSEANDSSTTRPISYGTSGSRTSWAQRAEDRTDPPGRTLARVVSPVAAVLPWLITVVGLALLARGSVLFQRTFEVPWGYLLGGAAVLVLAALIWAALTAWSSSGTTIAGVLTLAAGVLLAAPGVDRQVYPPLTNLAGSQQELVHHVVTSMNLLLWGSLLLAAGLGAAGARRWRR